MKWAIREENNKVVSSANNEIEDSVDSAISLTTIRNNKGPRTEPCVTPQLYSRQGRITEGQRGQLPRALRTKGAPRVYIYLF